MIVKKTAKQTAFNPTIVAPVGKLKTNERITPNITHITDTTEETSMVLLKPFDNCRAVTVGNIIMLEINIVPTTRIPRTMVIDVSTDIK